MMVMLMMVMLMMMMMMMITSSCLGWTLTEGVEAAYGESKSYLQPLRSVWEGAEGIIWLCVAPKDEIEDGAFYLDRKPQVGSVGRYSR